MRRSCCLAVLVAAVSFAQAQLPQNFESEVDKICKEWNRPNAPGGVVGVAMDGKLVFAKGYGMANLETNTPNTRDTVMDVGSVSKQFTAMSILLLEEEGKLKTSDSVSKYVPELPDYGRPITIDNLLHMTSGLRDYISLMAVNGWNVVDARTFQDAIDIMCRQTGPNSVPGEKWNYCNTGYMLMAVIVQRVSGESLAQFAKEKIFTPLEMKDTQFVTDPQTMIPNRATSYQPTQHGYQVLFSSLAIYGDGGVHTTLADLTRWHENFYANKLGKGDQKLIDKMVTPGLLSNGSSTGYGCGLMIDTFEGLRRIRHGGNWLGYNAMTVRFPDKHVSLFALGNDGTNLSTPYCDSIARLLFGIKAATQNHKQVAVNTEILKGYVGTYRLPDGRIASISLAGDQLSAQVTGQPKFDIFPESETSFFLKVVDAQFEFVKDSDGKIGSAKIHQGGKTIDLVRTEPFKPNAAQLKALVGTYKSFEMDMEVTIRLEAGKLTCKTPDDLIELSMPSEDKLTAQGLQFDLVRDAEGTIRGLSLDLGRATGMKFIKQEGA